ncbi:hypothetical protein RIF29_27166 [Crotalaria pallida]|uniref:Uncharacterized protein n=1 Tax=Crotalaria pallida TaxID=3830 RepID=A0AAN9ENK6_CROPI
MDEEEEESVFGDGGLTWEDVAEASAANERPRSSDEEDSGNGSGLFRSSCPCALSLLSSHCQHPLTCRNSATGVSISKQRLCLKELATILLAKANVAYFVYRSLPQIRNPKLYKIKSSLPMRGCGQLSVNWLRPKI